MKIDILKLLDIIWEEILRNYPGFKEHPILFLRKVFEKHRIPAELIDDNGVGVSVTITDEGADLYYYGTWEIPLKKDDGVQIWVGVATNGELVVRLVPVLLEVV